MVSQDRTQAAVSSPSSAKNAANPSTSPPKPAAATPKAAAPSSAATMVDALESKNSATLSIDLWCALVDNLEAKGVFSRAELIAMLKKLGQP